VHDKSLGYIAIISPEVQVRCAVPRKEKLARREKIINGPDASTKSSGSGNPQPVQKSSKEKVLQKGEKMKKLKKLGCANG